MVNKKTGEYNISYINRLIPDRKIALINLVHRQQGLILTNGNPKGIKGLADLVKSDITFCNRQRGSGTRILLDYQLGKLGIDPAKIEGYEREVYTHMAVASAVATGIADAGLGIFAAAKALGLGFVTIVEERYDLAIPVDFLSMPAINVVLETIKTDGFQKRVQALGGYDTRDMGKRLL